MTGKVAIVTGERIYGFNNKIKLLGLVHELKSHLSQAAVLASVQQYLNASPKKDAVFSLATSTKPELKQPLRRLMAQTRM